MNANDLFNAVTQLDLEPIKTKLMHVASGEGWTRDKADAVEKEYRRFLCLMKLFPNEDTAPLVDVDTFWHYHILDTMKYALDCEQVFGYFLHHYPYVGLEGSEDDEQFRLDSGKRMGELYEATFGEVYPDPLASAAFCAGPTHDKLKAHADAAAIAFCAGPTHDQIKAHAGAAGIAFCAGPTHDQVKAHAGAAGIAFCAGPTHDQIKAHAGAAAIAFCAGPTHDKIKAYGTMTLRDSAFQRHAA